MNKEQMAIEDVLQDLERRIRAQAQLQEVMSMPWRAHYADLAHINDIRRERGLLK